MPDPDSVIQEIKRVHLQCHIWINCLNSMIPELDIEQFDWKIDDNNVRPVWFVGNQLPDSLIRKKHRNVTVDGNEADNEEESEMPKRKRRRTEKPTVEVDIDTDNEREIQSESEQSDDFSSIDESDDSSDSSDSDYLP